MTRTCNQCRNASDTTIKKLALQWDKIGVSECFKIVYFCSEEHADHYSKRLGRYFINWVKVDG